MCGRAITASMTSVGYNAAATPFLDRASADTSPGGPWQAWLDEVAPDRDPLSIAVSLNRVVALIDQLINDQLNAILHHPAFQRLEAQLARTRFSHQTTRRPRAVPQSKSRSSI